MRSKNLKKWIIFILISSLILKPQTLSINSTLTTYPVVDGILSENEWSSGERKLINLFDGTLIETTVIFNETHFFILCTIMDDDPTLFNQKDTWDVFGVEFDVNKDQVPMGMYSSPDDALFVSYSQIGGQDFILQGMGNPVVEDLLLNGTNDVRGVISITKSQLFIEVCKSLDSGDQKGADIALGAGDSIKLMYAYWDNKDPHTQTTSHSDWIEYIVPKVDVLRKNDYIFQIIIEFSILILFAIITILFRFQFKVNIFKLLRNG